MRRINIKNSKISIYIMAFIIPIILMVVVFIYLGVYPFGEKSILIADMRYQFSDYYAYYKSIMSGENNIFYTFSKNLGGDMLGFFSYYLQNPLCLVFFLFSRKELPIGILCIIIITAGISGFSFNYYLNHIFKPQWSSIIFSTAYAFIGFFVAYLNCTIYSFDIAICPFVMLGIHKIVKNYKDRYLYMFSLASVIILNYYIGYMICLFAALYFIFDLLREMKTIKQIRNYIKHIVSFIVTSSLAGALTAIEIIPTLLSLSGEKHGAALSGLTFYYKFKMKDIFTQLYSLSFDGNISDGKPLLYVGILAVIFVLIYLLNKNTLLSERVLAICFLTILLLGFCIHSINIIWHGFNDPIGFPHRNAFVFSFMMLHYAYFGYMEIKDTIIKKSKLLLIFSIFLAYSIYLLFFVETYISGRILLYNAIVMGTFLILIYLYENKPKWKTICIISILLIQGFDLVFNAISSISKYPVDNMDEYVKYISEADIIISDIKDRDQSFYRMEKTFRRTHNDAMQFSYSGLSHFSSVEKNDVTVFMGRMGFRNYGDWSYYNDGSTTFTDCFLGVKYLLSQWDAIGKPYEKISVKYPYYEFENPYVLPLGFGITKDIDNVNMENRNLFEIQNEIADSFKSKNNQILSQADVVEINTVNLNKKGNVYTKIDSEKEAFLEYKIKVDNANLLYIYFTAPYVQDADIYVNGTYKGDYFTIYDWDIDEIGDFKIGDEICVQVKTNLNTLTIDDAYFYYENKDAIAKWYQQSEIVKWSPEKISSSHLKGTVQMTDAYEYLMITLPYEKDWIVKVDGRRAETFEVLDALMAIKLDPGKHVIEMWYVPVGLYIGIPVTLISIFAIIVIYGYDKKREKIK